MYFIYFLHNKTSEKLVFATTTVIRTDKIVFQLQKVFIPQFIINKKKFAKLSLGKSCILIHSFGRKELGLTRFSY